MFNRIVYGRAKPQASGGCTCNTVVRVELIANGTAVSAIHAGYTNAVAEFL